MNHASLPVPAPPISRRKVTASRALALLALVGLSACSTIRVKIRPDEVSRGGVASARLLRQIAQPGEDALVALSKSGDRLLGRGVQFLRKHQDQDAAACFLKAAVEARAALVSPSAPQNPDAQKALRDLHNRALARFAELWAVDPRRSQAGPQRLTVEGETFEVVLAPDSHYPSGYFDRVIATESITGKGVIESKREGYGASLVGIREQRPERADEMRFFPKPGLHVPVTLVMGDPQSGADATRIPVSLVNPMLREKITVHGRDLTLAADFSAPFEVLLNGKNQSKASVAGFFGADKRIKDSGIFLLEPYDPKRIPVILTHGLVSVPLIWRDLVAQLLADPEISRRYQLMVFTYPSSYVIAESALLYRQELAALRAHYDPDGNDPLSRNMVAIGHSMGGMLTHLLVAEVGDNLWKQFSDKSFDDMSWNAEAAAKARELAFFEPDPAVHRAVFIATPHGGARKAQAGVSGLVSRFVKLPRQVLATTRLLASAINPTDLKINLGKHSTSIQSLKPDSPIVKALAASPYRKGVVYHSIIGDRGRGDTPNSSDGTVEYWSSHQEGAASEIIVPTGHSAYTSPLAVEEVKRILRLHVGIGKGN